MGKEGPYEEILQNLKPKPASAAKLPLTRRLPGTRPAAWEAEHLQDGPWEEGFLEQIAVGTRTGETVCKMERRAGYTRGEEKERRELAAPKMSRVTRW